MPKVLFIGDIVGRPGRAIIQQHLPALRQRLGLSLVVANAENAAAGAGCTRAIAEELLAAGVDAITLGDHVWDQRNFEAEIGQLERVCRPANLPANCPGRTSLVVTDANGFRLGIFTLLGKNYMKISANCPFEAVERMLPTFDGRVDALMVEVHAEATSEKVAMGWLLDGRVGLVVGTHTHIPTADASILPRGTAYLTDAGMTGPYASVLGRQIQPILARFFDGIPRKCDVAEEDVRLCGCIVDLDPATGLARDFQPFKFQPE